MSKLSARGVVGGAIDLDYRCSDINGAINFTTENKSLFAVSEKRNINLP